MNPVTIRASYIAAKADVAAIGNLKQAIRSEPVILYQASRAELKQAGLGSNQKLGIIFMIVALGAFLAAVWPFVGLEASYAVTTTKLAISDKITSFFAKPIDSTPVVIVAEPDLNPLVAPDGTKIVPVNTDFSLIIPSIGVNAPVIPGVNPASKVGYNDALKKGVAHSSTSFYPNENGTVYLFSHSTNYEWFVKDLNAIFFLLKNVKPGEFVVVMYMGDRYTYKIRESKVVSKREVAYLKPQFGTKTLILQTCWPPGTDAKRMLFFADFVEAKHYGDFQEEMDRPTEFGQIIRLATLH